MGLVESTHHFIVAGDIHGSPRTAGCKGTEDRYTRITFPLIMLVLFLGL
jgi:hypothetical protein